MIESSKTHGLLFGNHLDLRYFDLKERKTHTLDKDTGPVYAICASNDDVYYGAVKDGENLVPKVKSLLGGFESEERAYEVTAMVEHKGRLLDAERTVSSFGGGSNLRDTLENRILISGEELRTRCISYIMSLRVCPNNNLFGLVKYSNYRHGLIEINENEGNYFLDKGNFDCNEKLSNNLFLCDSVIIPHGNTTVKGETIKKNLFRKKIVSFSKNYLFSVISCANGWYSHLDLNGELIKGTETMRENNSRYDSIVRIEHLTQEGDIAEIVYTSGGYGSARDNENSLVKVKIDLRKKELLEKEFLINDLDECATALEPVRNLSLHQKIIRLD